MDDDIKYKLAKLQLEVDAMKLLLFKQKIALSSQPINIIPVVSKKVIPVNNFKLNQIVELQVPREDRVRGKIVAIACKEVRNKKCDKVKCTHEPKLYVWVSWPNNKVYSYYFKDLRLMTDEDLKPKIGKELSGRIGPWTFNAQTKIWRKDNVDKDYSEEEFRSELYFDSNPYLKEEAKDFVKKLIKANKK